MPFRNPRTSNPNNYPNSNIINDFKLRKSLWWPWSQNYEARYKSALYPSKRCISISILISALLVSWELIGGASASGDFSGGSILVPVILDRVGTPYFVKNDVIIEETGELTIRPGVQLLFAPTVGITVFGRLIAEVNNSFLVPLIRKYVYR